MRHSALLLPLATLTLAGCAGFSPNSAPTTYNGALNITGSVHGGQQPVAGAQIYLYAVGTAATGAASTSLLTTAVVTGAAGNFSITGDYTCGSATQVYLVAAGGNSGAGTNSAIAMTAALGPCSGLTSSSFVQMNELTTVAAAYALAPFEGATYTNIGSNATATGSGTASNGALGIANAFNTAQALVSSATGTFPTLPTGLTAPTSELNTLADILAACINTAGASSSPCTTLFTATGANNTLDAAFSIAKKPGNTNSTGLYTLATPASPFQPTLAAAPNDFTVALRYTGTVLAPLNHPTGIAIDGRGNAFVTSQVGNSVTAITPVSTTFASANNAVQSVLNSPQGIAIDTFGDFWIANTSGHNVVEFAPLLFGDPTSFAISNSRAVTGFGAAANPTQIAIDLNGNPYTVSSADNTAYAVSGNAGSVSASLVNASFTGSAIALSAAGTVAIGTSTGQICTTNLVLTTTPNCNGQGTGQNTATTITALSYNTSASSAGYTGGAPFIFGNQGVYGATLGASPVFVPPFSFANNPNPTALAIDSAGNAFLTSGNILAEVNGTTVVSPNNGYGTLSNPLGVAVDPSGNVWVPSAGDNSISIFVGLGAPTITPIAANLH